MSTEPAQRGSDRSRTEWLARGADQVLEKLVFLSPFAIALLLVSERAQQSGEVLVFVAIGIAVAWATWELKK